MLSRCPIKPLVFFVQLTRQSSVAYLASFLARGSFVDPSLVSTAVQSLLDWAGQYLDQHVDASTAAAAAATVQAVGTPTSKVRELCVCVPLVSFGGAVPNLLTNGNKVVFTRDPRY